jgi:hypothetical protein
MRGILADINAEGILTRLRFIWLSSTWRELWLGLDLSVADFVTLGLPFDAPDPIIWRTCQRDNSSSSPGIAMTTCPIPWRPRSATRISRIVYR